VRPSGRDEGLDTIVGSMSRCTAWAVRVLLVLSPLLVLAVVLAGLPAEAPLVAPVLVLLAPLLFGRYLGEARITRLRDHIRRPAPRRHASPQRMRLRRTPCVVLPRGGDLLAAAMAVRPPPGPTAS
jgi:hypothetical protein